MDCKFAEKISLLIDGELPETEIEQVKAHLAGCDNCQQSERDFLYLRRQIKDSISALEERDLIKPARRKNLVWGKRILLPAPAFVLFLLMFAALAIWTITANIERRKNITVVEDSVKKDSIQSPPLQNARVEISLSRFDHGGRAEIYTVKREARSHKTQSVE